MSIVYDAIDKLVPPRPVYTVDATYDTRLKLSCTNVITFNGTPTTPVEKLVFAVARWQINDRPDRIDIYTSGTNSSAHERIGQFFLNVAASADKKAYPNLFFWVKRYFNTWTLSKSSNEVLANKLATIFNYGAQVAVSPNGPSVSYDPTRISQLVFMLNKVKTDTQTFSREFSDESDPDKGMRRRRRGRRR